MALSVCGSVVSSLEGAQQPPDEAPSGLRQACAAADAAVGQDQLDPGGGFVVPGQLEGNAADLLTHR